MALRGITFLLERVFWPTYSHKRATKGVPASATRIPGEVVGFARGTAVDAEVCAYVNKGVKPTHAFARKVLKALRAAGLKCVRAQIPVRDEEVGLRTGVDLLCSRRDAKGERTYVIVEIKCGCDKYDSSDGKMRRFLSHLPNSARFQHQVQTVVTRALFMKTHPEAGDTEAIIARITNDGVHLHPVDRALFVHAPAIMKAISVARDRFAPKSSRGAPTKKVRVRVKKNASVKEKKAVRQKKGKVCK